MILSTPSPFPHGDSAGGAPSPCSGQKKDSAGDGEEQALHGARRRQRAVELPHVTAHDRADTEVQADRPAGRLRENPCLSEAARGSATIVCRASRGCNDGVLAVDGL